MGKRKPTDTSALLAEELDRLVANQSAMTMDQVDTALEGIRQRALQAVAGEGWLELEVERRIAERALVAAYNLGSPADELSARFAKLSALDFTNDDKRAIMTLIFARGLAERGSAAARPALEALVRDLERKYPPSNRGAREFIRLANELLEG